MANSVRKKLWYIFSKWPLLFQNHLLTKKASWKPENKMASSVKTEKSLLYKRPEDTMWIMAFKWGFPPFSWYIRDASTCPEIFPTFSGVLVVLVIVKQLVCICFSPNFAGCIPSWGILPVSNAAIWATNVYGGQCLYPAMFMADNVYVRQCFVLALFMAGNV